MIQNTIKDSMAVANESRKVSTEINLHNQY